MVPTKIIQVLLKCTWEEAALHSKRYFNRFQTPESVAEQSKVFEALKPPVEFYEFSSEHDNSDLKRQSPFVKYLRKRGLSPEYVCPRYNLRWTTFGEFAHRIIVPVIFEKEWRTFTARAIGDNALRYKACSDTKNRPDDFLFDYDNLTGGKALIVTEGAFDAISIVNAFLPFVSSTALFGKNLSARQTNLLSAVAHLYDRVVLALDEGTEQTALQMYSDAQWYIPNLAVMFLKEKDFNSMTADTIRSVLTQELNKGDSNVA